LLNGRQSSFDNLINGFVSTAAEDRSNPALLFRSEMNRHMFVLPGFVILRLGQFIGCAREGGAVITAPSYFGCLRDPRFPDEQGRFWFGAARQKLFQGFTIKL